MAGDLEEGNPAAEERANRISMAINEKETELEEYSNLVRYISTYRDAKGGVAAVEEEQDYDEGKRPWYAFWRKETGPMGAIDIPAEWLETDIARGLTSDEVEKRRRKTGYNELADIKENMFLKFIGFFRGPVLYGKSYIAMLP
jgi:H+-transporting ATPase